MSKKLLEFAVQQFTGYRQCEQQGNQILLLVESMGLTAKEWSAIRDDVQWLGNRIWTK